MFDVKTPGDWACDLGARVRALRLQRNITQAALARQAGVSPPTLGALERRGHGTVDTLARVMYSLGRETELAELLQPDPPTTLEEPTPPVARQRARS